MAMQQLWMYSILKPAKDRLPIGKLTRGLAIVGFSFGCFTGNAQAEQIQVAVASNFMAPMKAIVTNFEQRTGHQVQLSFGASGKFYAQIKNGAPFQLFLSADQEKPIALGRDGLVVPDSRFTYALGSLVLWSGKPGFIDGEASVLRRGQFNKLALANPKLAPYGVAAVQVLEKLNLRQTTESKWVQGENIAQTFQFVSTGNAELGFIALSQVIDNGKIKTGSAWLIPEELYQPIRQDAVWLRQGENSKAAKALWQFLQTESTRQLIKRYGYQVENEQN